jgi:hypothetical protein
MSIREEMRTAAAASPSSKPSALSAFGKRVRRVTASWLRWLHIYASMFGLAVTLFFSATGITLNHPDWFGEAERHQALEGELNPAWVAYREVSADAGSDNTEQDPLAGVAKLEVVEFLRSSFGVRGAVSEFGGDDRECFVNFKGPGYSADATINRKTGKLRLSTTSFGLVAVLNDLHKGRDSGKAWSLVIDISAVILCFISLTGLGLIFFLKLRRIPGLLIAVLRTAIAAVLYVIGVP